MSDLTIEFFGLKDAKLTLLKRKRSTQEALSAAVDKWKVIVALRRGGVTVTDGGPHSCGLCQKFYFTKDCEGCPVKNKTKQRGCDGTPYETWRRTPFHHRTVDMALRELKFLESLKP